MYITADCKFFDNAATAGISEKSIVNGNKGASIVVEVTGGTGSEIAIQGRILPGQGEWHNIGLINMSTLDIAKTISADGIYTGDVNGLCDIRANILNHGGGNVNVYAKVGYEYGA